MFKTITPKIKMTTNHFKIFKNGLMTGLLLQMALGPVFFYIVNLALQKSIGEGLAGVVAVTLVDYFYITLSIFGIGKILEHKNIKKGFGIMSSVVLMIFGANIFKSAFAVGISTQNMSSELGVFSSFGSVFLLTILSPLTIIFFTSLFTAKAVEYNYTRKELFVFGFATGLATFIFMGTSVVTLSIFKANLPLVLMQILNALVGCLLVGYGLQRLIKSTFIKSRTLQ